MENKLAVYFQKNKEKTLCFGAVAGALIIFLTLGLFLALSAKANFQQVQGLKLRLEGIRRFQQQVDFVNQRGELLNQLENLEERLPEQLEVNELLLNINSRAALNSIQVENLAALPEQGAKQQKSLRLGLVCQGQCQSLLNFMKNLESEGNLMFFDNVVMTGLENNQVELSATLTYFLR